MSYYPVFNILQHPSLENPLVWQTKSPQLQGVVAETAFTFIASRAIKWSLLHAVVDATGQLNILYLESTDDKNIAAIKSLGNEILQKLTSIQKKPELLRVSQSITTFAWLDTIVYRTIPHQTALVFLKNYFAYPANAAQHNQELFMAPDPIKQAEWLKKIDQIADEPSEQERERLAEQLKQDWIQHIPAVKRMNEHNQKVKQHNQEIFARRNAEISSQLKELYQECKNQLGANTRLALLKSCWIPQQVFVIGQAIQVQHQELNLEQQAVILPLDNSNLHIEVGNTIGRPRLVFGSVKNIQDFKYELLPFEEKLAQFDALVKQDQYRTINHHVAAFRHLIIEQKNAYLYKKNAFYQARLTRHNKADASEKAKILQEDYPDTVLRQLEEMLNKTNYFLENPTKENYLAYQAFANSLPGHSVLWQQITGAMLILAGAVLAIACGAVIAASFGVALPVAVPVVSLVTTWGTAGSALLLAGLGIFACDNARERGLAKAVNGFAKVVPLHEGLPEPQDEQASLLRGKA